MSLTELSKQYLELPEDTSITCEKNSASGSIAIGSESYFYSDSILEQFERLMKLIKFKRKYEGHAIEICVDNATTYSSRDFSKGVGTRCPVQFIEWVGETNNKIKLNCYFTDGEHTELSKGLLVLAQELGLRLLNKCKLNELKEILSRYDAFKNVTLAL